MTFKYVIVSMFLATIALEVFAVVTGNYTISDLILDNFQLRYRVFLICGLCAFLVYHFLIEYK